jgi:hypothetical protein
MWARWTAIVGLAAAVNCSTALADAPAAPPARVPRIVGTSPAALANNVSPALDKITVTFDQEMMDNSWSWTGGGKTFPKVAKPYYDAANMTCTLPCKLEPGKVYWVGVNSPSFHNFVSAEGAPAPRYVILFATQSADGKPTTIPDDLLKQANEINARASEGDASHLSYERIPQNVNARPVEGPVRKETAVAESSSVKTTTDDKPGQTEAALASRVEAALRKKVSLFGPEYPLSYPGAPTDKLSVQYAVIEIAKQAGLEYNWNESYKNTDPICRRWVHPDVHDQTCDDALRQILGPVGLHFRIENGRIVLVKAAQKE